VRAIEDSLSELDSPREYERSRALRERAHAIIPGGAHTYAKGDDQYPEQSPAMIVRGDGCHVWDPDGNEFIEYGMGLRSVTLGHGCRPVVMAAYRAMQLGTNFTRPAPIEVECAEELLSLLPGAEMVKFAKNGSDATTGAVKLARAYTGRDLIAICWEHPFFSVDDWFIGTTGIPGGVPRGIREMTLKFHYNDADSLRALFEQHPNQIACVVLEAATAVPPENDFLQRVRELCTAHGALMILDEMITGFRWDLGGAQQTYGVTPDLSTFGKALGNGFAIAALVGKREFMERGGLRHPHERVFLLSTTHGAETHALAAALAVMHTYKTEPVIETLHRQGERLRRGIASHIAALGIGDHFQVLGRACNLVFATRDRDGKPSQPFRTLFLQEVLRRGVISPSLVVSYAHTDEDIDRTIDAVAGALQVYQRGLEDGVSAHLVGRPVAPVYRPYN